MDTTQIILLAQPIAWAVVAIYAAAAYNNEN